MQWATPALAAGFHLAPPPPSARRPRARPATPTKRGCADSAAAADCCGGGLRVVRRVGEGAFGEVFLVDAPAPDGDAGGGRRLAALKVVSKASLLKTQQAAQVVGEARLHAAVSGHPCVAACLGRWQDDHSLYLLTEFCPGGELYGLLQRPAGAAPAPGGGRPAGLPPAAARFYLAQVVLALGHVHAAGIAYRDLKPENLLLGADGYLRLVDFGFAAELAPGEKSFALCGTPEYLAPEVIFSRGHDKGVDYWALGVLAYELLCGRPPFTAADPLAIYKRVAAGDVTLPAHLSGPARDLLRNLLVADTTRRFGCRVGGVGDVMRHRFFEGLDWGALAARALPPPYVPPPPGPAERACGVGSASVRGGTRLAALQARLDAAPPLQEWARPWTQQTPKMDSDVDIDHDDVFAAW
jgi:serine/threonine protein kinase